MPRKLLNTAEVADIFRVSPQAIRLWVRDGKLRSVTIGRDLRFIEDDINEFIEARVTASRAAADEGVDK